jgi:hypothetical protein
MTCRTVKRQLKAVQLARAVASGGTAGAQTAVLYVSPISPKLKVAVETYFRPDTQGGTIPSSGNTVTYGPAVKDSRGDILALHNVETTTALPYGIEYSTAAEFIKLTYSLSRAASEAGTWFARVSFFPMPGVCEEEFEFLAGQAAQDLATPVRLLGT